MGHVINPISYRLGNKKKWVSGWFAEDKTYKVFVQEDFLLYRLLKLFFMQYAVPVFEEKEVRNPKTKTKATTSGKDNIIPSPFVEFSFAFSHVNITRGYALGINCHFMDSLLENWRRNVVKQPNLTSSRIFKPIPKRTFVPYFMTQLRSLPKLQTMNTQWQKFRLFVIKKKLKKWLPRDAREIRRLRYSRSRGASKYSILRNYKGSKYFGKYNKIPSSKNTRKYMQVSSTVKSKKSKTQKLLIDIPAVNNLAQITTVNDIIAVKQMKPVTGINYIEPTVVKKSGTDLKKTQLRINKKTVIGKKQMKPIKGTKLVSLRRKKEPKLVKKGLKSIIYKKGVRVMRSKKSVKKRSIINVKKKIIIKNKKSIVLKNFSTLDNKKVLRMFRKTQLSTIAKRIKTFPKRNLFIRRKRVKTLPNRGVILDNKQRIIYLRKKIKFMAKRAKKRYLLLFKNKKFAKAHPEMSTPFTRFARKKKMVRRIKIRRIRARRSRRRYERRFFARAKRKKWHFNPIIQNDTQLKMFPLSLYQLIFQSPRKLIFPPAKRTFKLLKVLLLMFPAIIKSSVKRQFFFLTTLRQSLMSLFALPFFLPKMVLIRTITLLFLKETSFKHTNIQYFRKIISNRFLIFQGAHSAIISAIKSFDKNSRIIVSFLGMHMGNLSASLTCNYIIYKLGQYFSIQEIFRNLLRDLRRSPKLSGFRIVVAGRLTRKERAAYLIRQKGRLDLSAKASLIDYASDFKIMRFGVVGVKVWFNQRQFTPTYYVFKFTTEASKAFSKNLFKTTILKKRDKSTSEKMHNYLPTNSLDNSNSKEQRKKSIQNQHQLSKTQQELSNKYSLIIHHGFDSLPQSLTQNNKNIRNVLIKRNTKMSLCPIFKRTMRNATKNQNAMAAVTGTSKSVLTKMPIRYTHTVFYTPKASEVKHNPQAYKNWVSPTETRDVDPKIKAKADKEFKVKHPKIVEDRKMLDPKNYKDLHICFTHKIPSKTLQEKYDFEVLASVLFGVDEKGNDHFIIATNRVTTAEEILTLPKNSALTAYLKANPNYGLMLDAVRATAINMLRMKSLQNKQANDNKHENVETNSKPVNVETNSKPVNDVHKQKPNVKHPAKLTEKTTIKPPIYNKAKQASSNLKELKKLAEESFSAPQNNNNLENLEKLAKKPFNAGTNTVAKHDTPTKPATSSKPNKPMKPGESNNYNHHHHHDSNHKSSI